MPGLSAPSEGQVGVGLGLSPRVGDAASCAWQGLAPASPALQVQGCHHHARAHDIFVLLPSSWGTRGAAAAPLTLLWSPRAPCQAVLRHPTPRSMMVMPAGVSPILLPLVLLLCRVAPSGQEPAPVQLRLAGPRGLAGEGRLEVLYQGRWGTVCDDGFDFHAATVACRQLGYTAAITWTHSATYGQGEGRGQVENGGAWGPDKDSVLSTG